MLGKNWLPDTEIAQRLRSGWRLTTAFFDRLYRERELILRSEGQVKYLRLTRGMQIISSVVVVCVFSWAFGMTALWEIQRDVINDKAGQIKDAEVAYGDLLDEILTYQEKVADVTKKLQDKHAYLLKELGEGTEIGSVTVLPRRSGVEDDVSSVTFGTGNESQESLQIHLAQVDIELEQMTETTNLLENSLSKVKARLARAEFEQDSYARRGDTMQDQIRGLQDQLVNARARAARLDRVKKDLDQNLQGARESYAKIVTERGILKRRKRELENDLGASRARGDILHAEVAKLSQELDQAREKITTVVGHRSALHALVSRLETQLQSAENKIGGLEDDFNDMIAKLQSSTGGTKARAAISP